MKCVECKKRNTTCGGKIASRDVFRVTIADEYFKYICYDHCYRTYVALSRRY